MNINYNVTGPDRKSLVGAISEILALSAVYKGAPTFTYEIGNCMVDKNGTLIFSEAVNGSAMTLLKERGYEGETQNVIAPGTDSNMLEIVIPKEGFTDESIENLRKLIASKDTFIKKALDLYDLPFNENCLDFKVEDDKLRFPWFRLTGADGEADAYARFVCALCDMAKTQKRITAIEKSVENDKFTMRLFLVRLGLKGPENKAVRHIMLKNLTGNSSWKNGHAPERTGAAAECEDAGETSAGETLLTGTDKLAEAIADAQLIHEVNASLER